MNPVDDIESARGRFRELETSTLVGLWQREARMPHAETALRLELLERGKSEVELDEIQANREELARSRAPSERETIVEYGIIGRFIAVVLVMAIGKILSNLFGARVAALCVSVILISYVVLLVRRVALQHKHGASEAGSFIMVYQVGECVLIGLVALAGLFLAVAGRI